MKKTKDELIALLVERGHDLPDLIGLERDDLANLAEDAESLEFMAAEEEAQR